MPKCELLPSLFAQLLFLKSDCERIAPVALYKIVTVSDSLSFAHDKRATEAFRTFSRTNGSFAHKKEQFACKTTERISNPVKGHERRGLKVQYRSGVD